MLVEEGLMVVLLATCDILYYAVYIKVYEPVGT